MLLIFALRSSSWLFGRSDSSAGRRDAGALSQVGPARVAVLVLVLAPLIFSDFYLSAVITKALWLGIAAVSLIFLAGYVGMVSLGQVALYGIAGFTAANLAVADGGSKVALNPWVATLLGLVAAVAVGFFLGAIASRSRDLLPDHARLVLVYFFAQ